MNIRTGQWYCFAGCGGGYLPSFLKLAGKSRNYADRVMGRLKPHIEQAKRKKSQTREPELFVTNNPLPERLLGLFENAPNALLESGFDEDLLWDHDVGYDTERERITFPVRDIEGRLAGIVGRLQRPEELAVSGKYKVYRSELKELGQPIIDLDKSSYLWRWERVHSKYTIAGTRPTIYVTEGYKACLWMVQCGYEDTLALQGTSLSGIQKVFLERMGGTIIWCLDNDRAGRAGTWKNSYKLSGCRQRAVVYPVGVKQLDDMSPEALHEVTQSSLPIAVWRRRIKQNAQQAAFAAPQR